MDIKSRVLADPNCAAPYAARDLDALVAILNANPPMEARSRFVTGRTVLAECGALGPAILDSLTGLGTSTGSVKWALLFLQQDSGFDVGHPATQAMIDELASGHALPADQAAALKGMAQQPVLVSRADVEAALFYPNGSVK